MKHIPPCPPKKPSICQKSCMALSHPFLMVKAGSPCVIDLLAQAKSKQDSPAWFAVFHVTHIKKKGSWHKSVMGLEWCQYWLVSWSRSTGEREEITWVTVRKCLQLSQAHGRCDIWWSIFSSHCPMLFGSGKLIGNVLFHYKQCEYMSQLLS